MSDAAILGTDFRTLDRKSYFEQRLYAFSPFDDLATTFCIFAAFAVAYFLAATFDGRGALSFARNGLTISDEARGALTLSLLVATALGLQRYARVKDRQDVTRHHE